MTEELKQVDRSAIEQLVRIRQDEELLRERVAKAEATKAKVSPVVYQRVIADYRQKLDALEDRARPLKESARGEYAKLKALEEQYGKALQDVTIDKEELEFRNQLGEFSEGEFAGKLTELEGKVAEQRSRVDAANVLKSEFLAAFSSEAELDSPLAAPASAPVEAHEDAGSATVGIAALSVTAAGISRKVATKPGQSGSTVIFSIPKLVAIVDGQPAEEYVLKAKTSIGRTSRNDIQIFEDSVSRSHCEVVLGEEGYRIVDLGSHNGIVINGEKVAEHILQEGDLVQVGTRQFIFHQG